jgi:tetratricopeptide (TPR) repeat protein
VAAQANSRAGHLLMSLGRAAEAIEALRAAAAQAPTVPERRLDLVRALILEKKDAEAEVEARAALAEDPRSSDGRWLLGRLLSEAGRFQDARIALEQAVALEPRQGGAWYDLARSFTWGPSDRPLLERMLAATRAVQQSDQRIRLHLAIGKAFEDLGEYGAAMQHFGRANAIKAAASPFDREAFARRIDALIGRFSPAWLAEHAGDGSPSQTPVFVLGLPRSGTTLIEQILSSHPQVEGAGELQLWTGLAAAFGRLAEGAGPGPFQKAAAQQCLSVLGGLYPDARRVIDKTPLNYQWAGLIHLVFPKALIIHCRRDPLDTCVSIHSTYFAPRADFPTGKDDLVFYWRQYARLMEHWRSALPADRFVEVDYEALVAEPEPAARRLVAACGLDWDPACLEPERNTRIVRTASKWQARQPIAAGSVGRWRRYEPWLEAWPSSSEKQALLYRKGPSKVLTALRKLTGRHLMIAVY